MENSDLGSYKSAINKKECEVLTLLEMKEKTTLLDKTLGKSGGITQRTLASLLGFSLGTTNYLLKSLADKGLIKDKRITEEGLTALTPYKVERIVFIAAGVGERLLPVTLNTPKALVRIKGVRIIDRLIERALAVGIKEIVIVRGYLKEEFDVLLNKYPFIKLIDNNRYNESANITSLAVASEYLTNSYVCEADLILNNPLILTKYQYGSNYCGVRCKKTNDWFLHTVGDKIKGVSIGGERGYRMLGLSYWTKEDGIRLKECIKRVSLSPGGLENYWDMVPLSICKKEFFLYVRGFNEGDFSEVDTLTDLKTLDKAYNL